MEALFVFLGSIAFILICGPGNFTNILLWFCFLKVYASAAFILGGNAQLFLLTPRYPEYMKRA